MAISAEQCRAGRGLLGWTQDQLATNARVSRATVADFESNTRRPMTNNLSAIEDAMFAAGVDFIAEVGAEGVGVRFRERKLQYVKNVKIDTFEGQVTIPMTYAGKEFRCIIPRDVMEDHLRLSGESLLRTEESYRSAANDMLHQVLAAVERNLRRGHNQDGDYFMLRSDMLN